MSVDISELQRLKDAVAAKSDEELIAWAKGEPNGVDGVLEQIFETIPQVFRSEKAMREDRSVLQYLIDTPVGRREYAITIERGTCKTARGVEEGPTATLTVGFPDFLRIVTGRLAGMQAYLGGRLKIDGDALFVNRFEGWFDQP